MMLIRAEDHGVMIDVIISLLADVTLELEGGIMPDHRERTVMLHLKMKNI